MKKNESNGNQAGYTNKRTGAIASEGKIKRTRREESGVERKKVYKI